MRREYQQKYATLHEWVHEARRMGARRFGDTSEIGVLGKLIEMMRAGKKSYSGNGE